MTKSFIALSSLFIASATFAQTNPLSVHVLNLETGLPSSQVEVVLVFIKLRLKLKNGLKRTNSKRSLAKYP